MFEQDYESGVRVIGESDSIIPSKHLKGLTAERVKEYTTALRALQITLMMSFGPDEILLQANECGMAHAGTIKGYLFSRKARDSRKVVDDLDEYADTHWRWQIDLPRVHRTIEDGWYVFFMPN
jgi:hypothetical protein